MKVCIFGDSNSVHLQRIVPGLVERGIEVHVVTNKAEQIAGATVERFQVPRAGVRNVRRWRGRWSNYLRGFMKRFDVVNVHFLHDWGFTPEIIEKGCFVATPWGSDVVLPPGEGTPTAELVKARTMMLQQAHAITAWGPTFAGQVADFAGLTEPSIEFLPLGVDLELFKPMVSSTCTNKKTQTVGFFKGFREVYGATTLMRAVPTVVEAMSDVRFQMIGDGPQLEACKMLAGRFGVQAYVNWVRRQPHRNLPNYLAGWHLSVIPSVCESFGAAALECAAMKVPVVASDVGGLRETVRHGETGLLVPSEAPEQLAHAILTILKDETLRQRMGAAGRSMVEAEYEWGRILDKWVAFYAAVRERAAVMV